MNQQPLARRVLQCWKTTDKLPDVERFPRYLWIQILDCGCRIQSIGEHRPLNTRVLCELHK